MLDVAYPTNTSLMRACVFSWLCVHVCMSLQVWSCCCCSWLVNRVTRTSSTTTLRPAIVHFSLHKNNFGVCRTWLVMTHAGLLFVCIYVCIYACVWDLPNEIYPTPTPGTHYILMEPCGGHVSLKVAGSCLSHITVISKVLTPRQPGCLD